jgi:two-component system, LuxR family, sensor kinase FixL
MHTMDRQRPARTDGPMPPALAGAVAFGDALALFDAGVDARDEAGCAAAAPLRVQWVSPGWGDLLPALPADTPLAEVDRALPGAADALRRAGTVPRRWALGASGEWEALVVRLEGAGTLLRLCDRRELSRAVQRQLDDRERLLFTSRVISVGEMATTLAHELNQPIGAAANLLRGLRTRVARRSVLRGDEAQALDRAIEQVMFASRVIVRIREFTHSHQPRHARVDLSALLRASASLLDWDVRRSHARVALELPDGPALVRGDEVMLQQVIVNLLRNALDALRCAPPPDPCLTLSLTVGECAAELRVRDNGCGLDDEAAARLFVPFASNKPSGMGIGLSICRSFVELHQGRLWFSRNPDRGATFHLRLPLLAAATDDPPETRR